MKPKKSIASFALVIMFLVYGGACTQTQTVEVPVDRPVEVIVDGTTSTGTTGNAASTPSGETKPTIITVEGGGAVLVKDVIEPTVISMNPSDGLQGVAPSSTVTINFSESVDPASVSKESIQLKDSAGVVVDGSVTYNDDQKSATLAPTTPLLDSEQYTLTITKSIRDLAGNGKLAEDVAVFRVSAVKTIAVSVGAGYTLALKENGTLWAWGRNNNGQLGINSRTDQNRPVRVNGLQDIIAITAGGFIEFSLALDKEGHVWAWGGNSNGQLGDGTTQDRLTPHKIESLENIVAIAAGNRHCLALAGDGHVWAWGQNAYGQFGDGTTQNSLVPVQNPHLNHVKEIAAGTLSGMALVEDPETQERTLRTWGYNTLGGMGNGTMGAPVTTPVQVKTPDGTGILSNVDKIVSGGVASFAILKDKTLLAWGGNSSGQVGDGTTTHRSLPVVVMSDVVHVGTAPYSSSAFAVTADGALWGWGKNDYLQLMEATSNYYATSPRRIGTVSGVIMAGVGYFHSTLLKADGSVMTAGLNINGGLGTGTASFYSYHPNLQPTVSASKQGSGRFVRTQTGGVRAWGRNVDCELGMPKQGSEMMVPTEISIPDKVIQVAGSGVHMLALTAEKGEIWAWGRNEYGELGNGAGGAGQKSCVPQKVKGEGGVGTLGNIVAISTGKIVNFNDPANILTYAVSYAIQKNPDDTTTVWSWGQGVGNTPVKLPFPADAAPITQIANSTHGLALAADGKVYAWGGNSFGQYCTGTTTASATPVFTGMTDVAQVAAGNYHTVLRMVDGTVKTCGLGRYGELGNGIFTASNAVTATPQLVQGIGVVKYVAAGGYMSAAITQDGHLLTWGLNLWGQLGVGNSIDQSVPAPVRLADGTEFGDVAQVSLDFSGVADYSGVMVAIRNDGTVWDEGYSNIAPTYLVREGETGIFGVPKTVNWP